MTKIILVIGGSCAGKTTFVKEKFLKDRIYNNVIKPVRHCIVEPKGSMLLIGNYGIGKACEGADTIGFVQDPLAADLIKESLGQYKEILAEGERITKAGFWEKIAALGCPVDVYYLPISFEEAKKRKLASRMGQLWRGKTSFSEGFLKMTITKAKNFAEKSRVLGFNVIEVPECAE